ncbi:MAG: hypothetical protein GY730_09845, partial [bacterium]|nr:hypothetical protein [bacterium]
MNKKIVSINIKSSETILKSKEYKSNKKTLFNTYSGSSSAIKWFNKIQSGQDNFYYFIVKAMTFYEYNAELPYDKNNIPDTFKTIKPKFKNIKEEVLSTSFHPLSIGQWNQVLSELCVERKSIRVRNLKSNGIGEFEDPLTKKTISWKEGDAIKTPELMSILLYTNTKVIESDFKKLFRSPVRSKAVFMDHYFKSTDPDFVIPDQEELLIEIEEEIKELKKRHEEFCHWRSSFLFTVHKYSQPMGNRTFYVGMDDRMIINSTSSGICYSPLSTAKTLKATWQFAGARGQVLEIKSRDSNKELCRGIDILSMSSFPEDKEVLLSYICIDLPVIRLSSIEKEFATCINKKPFEKTIINDSVNSAEVMKAVKNMDTGLFRYYVTFIRDLLKGLVDFCSKPESSNKTPYIDLALASFIANIDEKIKESKHSITGPDIITVLNQFDTKSIDNNDNN